MQLARKVRQIATMLALLLPGVVSPAVAQTVHLVAPKGASITCVGTRGTETCPWPSVDSALMSGTIQGGDTLNLMDGNHDRVDIENRSFTPALIIQSATARNAIIDTVFLRNASGVTFNSVTVAASGAYPYALFQSDNDTSKIILQNSSVQSLVNVSDVLSWSASDWLSRRRHGVWLGGSYNQVLNCTIDTVQSGVWSSGTYNTIMNNKITNLSGDALRGGTMTTVSNNYVANFFRVDDDHIDGFQSIGSVDKPVKGLKFRRNTILEWVYPSSHPLRASVQGVGMFDGFYDEFTIRNNVIAVSAGHGLAVYGGRNGIITNNTVVNPLAVPENRTWIGVFNHKNGSPSINVIVANNLAMSFTGPDIANNVIFSNNQVIVDPNAVFQNFAAFDFRPLASSGFIDTGNPLYSPKIDIDGILRPQGAGPDKGAFEVRSSGESLPRRKTSDATTTSKSITSLASDEDTMPALKAPLPQDEGAEQGDGDPAAAQLIYDNRKPIRLRKFWTDGASQ